MILRISALFLILIAAGCGGAHPQPADPKVSPLASGGSGGGSEGSSHVLSLSVLTINAWALPGDVERFRGLDTHRPERLKILCGELKKGPWLAVLVQEIWANEDQELLKNCGYSQVVDLDAGERQSGLMILSRLPVQKSERLIFNLESSEKPYFAELGVKKGAIAAKLSIGKKSLWVVNTHFAANYSTVIDGEGKKGPTHEDLRRNQMRQLTDFVKKHTQDFKEPVIVGGDFNLGPSSGEKLWEEMTGENYLTGFKTAPGVDGLATYETGNSNAKTNEGKIDHIFSSPGFKPSSGKLVFRDPVRICEPGEAACGDRAEPLEMHLSDHFGFETVYSIFSKI